MYQVTISANNIDELRSKIHNLSLEYSPPIIRQEQLELKELMGSADVKSPTVTTQMTSVSPPPIPDAPVSENGSTQKEMDVRGIPFDARIHHESRDFTVYGKWKKKRGVSDELVAQVEAELLGKSVPSAAAVEAHSEPAVQAAAEKLHIVPPAVEQAPATYEPPPIRAVEKGITQVVQQNSPPLPPMSRHAHTFESFRRGFVQVMAALINEKKVTKEYLETLCEYFKISAIWDLTKNEDKLHELFTNFAASGLIVEVKE